MQSITLPTCSIIRKVNNDILADVLYYSSSFHGETILRIVSQLLNKAYAEFCSQNQGFAGKVCIVGHSLGGVIMYDLLANQGEKKVQAGSPGGRRTTHFEIDYPKLDFVPDHLFALGSPIGAVLVIRGQSFAEYRVAEKTRFHNIFHLFDPLAYRIEPLVDPRYVHVPPVILQRPNSNSAFQLSYNRAVAHLASFLPNLPSVKSPNLPSIPQLPSFPSLASVSMPTMSLPAMNLPAGFVPSLEALETARDALNRQLAAMFDSISSGFPLPWPLLGGDNGDGDPAQDNEEEDEAAGAEMPRKRRRVSEDSDAPHLRRTTDERLIAGVRGRKGRAGREETAGEVDEPRGVEIPRPVRIPTSRIAKLRADDASPSTSSPSPPAAPFPPPALLPTLASMTDTMNQMAELVRRSFVDPIRTMALAWDIAPESDSDDDAEDEDAGDNNSDEPHPHAHPHAHHPNTHTLHTQSQPSTLAAIVDVEKSLAAEYMGPDASEAVDSLAGRAFAAAAAAAAASSPPPSAPSPASSPSSPAAPADIIKQRIDFFMQAPTIDNVMHQYLIGLKAHFSYWGNKDMMHKIVKDILSDTAQEQSAHVET
ncbi:DDHD domain-containing protein [Blyttiomyces helicus]|uniref:DDHD domain-containing protein n=1 Tax=Blyttiomyces helicus TaxID=388810 RepID=A0A4P9WCK0_9FUNG|nr:DDHD domain-containing protein [Blyttiomyces helicus]|eukprot:RKO90389.1 DDHD domain-containing protein [Blyttiomyces helicus]